MKTLKRFFNGLMSVLSFLGDIFMALFGWLTFFDF